MTRQRRRRKTPTHLTQPQDAAGHAIPGDDVRESIQREIEKQRIRAEILAEEVARRRILEEEVRMELMLERHMALQRLESSAMHFDCYSRASQFTPGSSRIPQSSGHFEERSQALHPMMPSPQEFRFHGLPPFECHPVAAGLNNTGSRKDKPPSEPRKETIVSLQAKPETSASGLKAKVSTPVAEHHGASDMNLEKKPDVWNCVMCHVSVTSEKDLNQHLQGKKHRNKEAELVDESKGSGTYPVNEECSAKTMKPGNASGSTSNSSVKKAEKEHGKSSRNVGGEATQEKKQNNKNDKADSKSKVMAEAVDSVKIGESGPLSNPLNVDPTKKFTFWCEMCQVGALTANVFSAHENGKKHLAKLKNDKADANSKLKARAVYSIEIGESGPRTTPVNVDPAKKFTFWCEMCQVGALTANVFSAHENGKKHLAKLKSDKADAESKLKAKVVDSVKIGEPGAPTKPLNVDLNVDPAKKFTFWCEMCQVGASTAKVFSDHENGKKHLAKLKECKVGSGSAAHPCPGE